MCHEMVLHYKQCVIEYLFNNFYDTLCEQFNTFEHIRMTYGVNTLRPRQNGRHFADGIFTCIVLNENV